MNKSLVFSVAGTPRPQPRPRFVKGRVVSTVDPKAKLWRLAVERAVKAALAHRSLPAFNGAVRLTAVFTFEPPVRARKRIGSPHTIKPDASNLLKLVEDVMEDAGTFGNDSQVSKPVPEKWWGEKAGVAILVEDISAERRAPTAPAAEPPAWLTGPAS